MTDSRFTQEAEDGIGLSLRPRLIIFWIIFAGLGTWFLFKATPPQGGVHYFEVTIAADVQGIAQVFYDLGDGFREEDSVRRRVNPDMGPIVYRFPLPRGIYRRLRFDPIDNPGTATFSNAAIVGPNDQVIRLFTPTQFHAELYVPVSPIGESVLETHMLPGNKPIFHLATNQPLSLDAAFDLGHSFIRALVAGTPAFIFFFLLIAAAGSLPRPPFTFTLQWPALLGIGFALCKLWLVSAQTIFALGGSSFDDQLFLSRAADLLSGDWLGPYSQFTLMKGPMYSIFVAGVFLLGIPLLLAQHMLYIAACALLIRALRPRIHSQVLRLFLFCVLLFNPATFSGGYSVRIMRQNLLPALIFLIVAGFAAMFVRIDGPKRRLLPWALLAGVSLPAFWMTREEGIWLVPCIALLWLTIMVPLWRKRGADFASRFAIVALPAFFWAAGVGTVAGVNYWNYGIFTTCEFKRSEFKAAFGAMLRVRPSRPLPFIPVTREARHQLYAVSPSFAQLSPDLEGELGKGWAQSSEWLTHLPPSQREIAVGWFMWAIRDAVILAGHGQSGDQAMAFYAKIAREINEACDNGLIAAGPPRAGFLPSLGPEVLGPFRKSFQRAIALVVSFDGMSPERLASRGTPDSLIEFSDLTRNRLSPLPEGPNLPPKQRWLDRERLSALGVVFRAYRLAVPWASGTAAICLIAASVVAIVRRKLPFFCILSLGALGATIALTLIVALIEATSFPVVDPAYLTAAYGLWLLFILTGWIALYETLLGESARVR